MCEREVEEHQVAAADVGRQMVDHRRHRVVVAMADHAALRRAGRARRVDEREQVVLADRRDRVVERRWMLDLERCAFGLERRKVVEGQHVPQAGERAAHLLDFRDLGGILAEDADRLGVVEDVGDVLWRVVRRRPVLRRRRPAPARSRTAPSRASSARASRRPHPCARRARAARSRGSRRALRPRPTRPRASGRRAGRGRQHRRAPGQRRRARAVRSCDRCSRAAI